MGFGLGLRSAHYKDLVNKNPKIDWLEIIAETFLLDGGKSQYYLDYFNERYQIVSHSVSLSIGSIDPFNMDYLKKLKALLDKLNCPWFSDHICWTSVHGKNLHNLMPLPYTEETVTFISEKIKFLQEFMQRPFIFENVSSYVEFEESQMEEWDFIKSVCEATGCGVLLDINNVYFSAYNHHFYPMKYIDAIPKQRVYQFHLAGHRNKCVYLLDTHDEDIQDEVWDLYDRVIHRFPNISVLIERDEKIPSLNHMLDSVRRSKCIYEKGVLVR